MLNGTSSMIPFQLVRHEHPVAVALVLARCSSGSHRISLFLYKLTSVSPMFFDRFIWILRQLLTNLHRTQNRGGDEAKFTGNLFLPPRDVQCSPFRRLFACTHAQRAARNVLEALEKAGLMGARRWEQAERASLRAQPRSTCGISTKMAAPRSSSRASAWTLYRVLWYGRNLFLSSTSPLMQTSSRSSADFEWLGFARMLLVETLIGWTAYPSKRSNKWTGNIVDVTLLECRFSALRKWSQYIEILLGISDGREQVRTFCPYKEIYL